MFRKFIPVMALGMVLSASGISHAQTSTQNTSNSTTNTGATAYAIDGGNGYKNSSVDTVPAVGTIITSPTASCQQSGGAAASFLGGGFSILGDHTDKDCQIEEQARTLWNFQQQGTAIMMMCTFAQVRFTRAVENEPCPAAFDQPSDPKIVTQAAAQPVAMASQPKVAENDLQSSSASPTTPIPAPTNAFPPYCNAPDNSKDPAEQAQYNYDCTVH
jgi:hypothetical protein